MAGRKLIQQHAAGQRNVSQLAQRRKHQRNRVSMALAWRNAISWRLALVSLHATIASSVYRKLANGVKAIS